MCLNMCLVRQNYLAKVFKVESQVYFDFSWFGPSWPRETISITGAAEECAVLYSRVASDSEVASWQQYVQHSVHYQK